MKYFFYALNACIVICFSVHGLETLQACRTFAATHSVYPALDNDNLLKPDYSTLYESYVPTLLGRLKRLVTFERPLWTPEDFQHIIAQLGRERENNAYRGRFVQKIVPQQGDRFYVFTDMHAGFHFLIDILSSLEEQGKIRNDYTLTDSHDFFVFLGNVIDMGPYSMETLLVVLRLMQKNPDKVLYVRGKHEDREYWFDYGLRDELTTKAARYSQENIPFESDIKRFFNSLPLALYIMSYEEKTISAVKITGKEPEDKELDEEVMSDFFSSKFLSHVYQITDKKQTTDFVDVRSVIRPDIRGLTYTKMDGLRKTEMIDGALNWVALSSPITTHRALYEFFKIAYSILSIHGSFAEWTVSLFNKDVRQNDSSFAKVQEFFVVSGQELIEGKKRPRKPIEVEKCACTQEFTDKNKASVEQPQPFENTVKSGDEIVIGASLDMSGMLKDLGIATRLGISLVFDKVNAEGGIGGKHVRLVALDDGLDPKKARENIQKLLSRYKTDIILTPIGYATIAGYLDLIKNKDILVLFPSTGADELYASEYQYIMHMRPSYGDLDTALIRYAIEHYKPQRIAFVYESGLSAFGIDTHIKKADIAVMYKEFPHKENEVNFGEIIENIKAYDPQLLFVFSYASAEFIRQLGVPYILERKIFITESEENIRQFIAEKGLNENVIITQNEPNPETSQMPLMKEYRQAMGTRSLDVFSFEGYLNAAVLVEVLKKMTEPVSKEAVFRHMQAIKQWDFGGFELDYEPVRRQLYHTMWIDSGKPDWTPVNLRTYLGY